jgi:hypothetical protein
MLFFCLWFILLDLKRVNALFLRMELISSAEATAMLAKKARAGRGKPVFKSTWQGAISQAEKKPRTETCTSRSEPGIGV